jgi:hypothetical protein
MQILNVSEQPLAVRKKISSCHKRRMILWFSMAFFGALIAPHIDYYVINILLGIFLFLGGDAWAQNRMLKSTVFAKGSIVKDNSNYFIKTDIVNIELSNQCRKKEAINYIIIVYHQPKEGK